MARHYSKVIVELPDGPSDPPYAIVQTDCDVCGEDEFKIHVSHLGTLLRVLESTVASLGDDGCAESMMKDGTAFAASTSENKRKAREYLDRAFPGWKADHLRRG